MLGHVKDPVDGTTTLVDYTESGRQHRSSPAGVEVRRSLRGS
jgi:hypothetical protein